MAGAASVTSVTSVASVAGEKADAAGVAAAAGLAAFLLLRRTASRMAPAGEEPEPLPVRRIPASMKSHSSNTIVRSVPRLAAAEMRLADAATVPTTTSGCDPPFGPRARVRTSAEATESGVSAHNRVATRNTCDTRS